jgi:nicotinamide-nucleotide amidase
MDEKLETLAEELKILLTTNSLTLAVAESCTGGLLSHVLTGVSGSSQYFLGGLIAYSNEVKIENLGVQEQTILLHGAVSQETAQEMAENIREKFKADFGLSTTGIAGPTGGTPTKPVGLVWLGISTEAESETFECHFTGGRDQVKMSTVHEILHLLLERLSTAIE